MAIEKTLESQIVLNAQKQISTWEMFYSPRLSQIKKFEDMYALRVNKQLKNRFNIPLPILSGYIDTFKSKIDEFPNVEFNPQEEGDLRASKKITSLWEAEKGADRGQWAFIDRGAKTLAMFSGRAVYKYFAESNPKYRSNFENVDYYDFVFEPQGGADLEKHLFCGQINIFKSKSDIDQGVKDGLYNKSGLSKLILSVSNKDRKETDKTIENKYNRLISLGLSPNDNNFVGEDTFNLTEIETTFKGKRYYLFFDRRSGSVLRLEPLADVFEANEYPFVTWATHEDPFNFSTKSPCDDVYPVADSMVTLFNQALDNVQKRNWGMRGVDTSVVKNLNQLSWHPDGIVEFDGQKGNIRNALVELETPDNTNQVQSLVTFLDNYLGQKTGITPATQGQSDKDQKVGIFYGELQLVADRIDYVSKMYREAHAKLGKKFVQGLKEHMTEAMAVKILGKDGAEWTEIKREDLKEFDISISGGQAELQMNEIKARKQSQALDRLLASGTSVNKNWLSETILRQGDFNEEDIRRAMDINSDGNDEIMSEAAKAIQEIVQGKTPSRNRGATVGFVNKIIDYAEDNNFGNLKTDAGRTKDQGIFNALMEYANLHMPIAEQNAIRKAQQMVANGEVQGAVAGAKLPSRENQPVVSKEGVQQKSAEQTARVNPLVG